MRVVGLNTWGRNGAWNDRLRAIGDGLRALDPHVICLAEVWEDAAGMSADDIARAIGGDWHVHFAAAFEVPSDETGARREGNAILSRFPFVEREAWPLPEPTGDHERNLVFAIANTPWGKLPVFATHLSWMLHWGAARLMQCQQIRGWMKERAPIERATESGAPSETLPPVLVGDFNAPPEADEIRFLTGLMADPYGCYLADCFAWCGEGRGDTWRRDNPLTSALPLPERRIDYVFVRGPDRWHRGEPIAARVVLADPVAGTYASDHCGIYAEIRMT